MTKNAISEDKLERATELKDKFANEAKDKLKKVQDQRNQINESIQKCERAI